MMQFTCPACFSRNSLEAFLNDDAGRRAVKTAAKLPAQLGELVLLYAGLFRTRARALAWRRVDRLVSEIATDIGRGQIEWKGRPWIAPHDHWRSALEEIVQIAGTGKLTLPLESHGYLYAILSGIADKVEGAAERKIEGRRRMRADDGGDAVKSVGQLIGEIASVKQLIAAQKNESIKADLQGQLDRLQQQLADTQGGG